MPNEIIKTSFLDGQVTIQNSVLKCSKCGEENKSLKKAFSLQSHLMLIAGFVELHRNCTGVSIWNQ